MKKTSVMRRVLLVAALLAAGLVAALRTDTAGDSVCSVLRRELPRRAHLDVGIGQCRIEPLTQTVKLTGVAVFAEGSDETLLSAESAEVSLRAVFFGSVALDDVRLIRPRVTIDLRGRQAPAKGAPGCPLTVFKQVSVDRLSVKDAQVELTLADQRRVDLEGLDVDWTTRRGVIAATVSLRSGKLEWGPNKVARLGQALIDAELDVGGEALSLQRVSVSLDGMTLSVTGSIEALCDASPRLAVNAQVFAPVMSAMRLASGSVAAGGTVWARASVTGRAQSPTVRAEVQGSEVTIGQAKPGDFTARGSFSGHEVVLDELLTRVGPQGTVKISGAVKLEPGFPTRVKFETQEASLGRILDRAGVPGAWVDLPATARGSLGGTLSPKVALQGDADVKVGHFVLAARPFDGPESVGPTILTFTQGHTDVHVGISNERVELTNIQAQVGPASATRVSGDVALNFDQEQGLLIHARAESLQLSDFKHISGLPWAGQGTAQVTIAGPYRAVSIEGQVALHDFELMGYAMGVVSTPLSFKGDTLSFEAVSGQKGRTLYFGGVDLGFRKEGLHIGARVQVPRGRTEDLVDVIAGLHPSLTSFQNGVLTGDVTATAQIDSPAKSLTGVMQFGFKDTRYYGRRLGDGPATLRFLNGEALGLDAIVLQGPLGATTASGRWFFSGPLDFQGKVTTGALAELIGPTTGVTGPFKLEVTVEGDTTTPVVSGTLASAGVAAGTTALGPATLEGRMVGKELEINGSPIAAARGQLKMKIKEPYPYEGKVTVALDEIRPFLPRAVANQGLNGAIAGLLTGSGDLRGFDTLAVQANLDKVWLTRGDVSVSNEGPVQLAWAAGRLEVASLTMKGTNTELAASGTWGPTTADMKARGALDLRLLDSFVPQVERLTGRLDLTATVTGPVKDPTVVGSADLADARFQVKDQALAVRALSGRLEFSKSRVLLQGFRGFLNDGRLDVRGDVRLDGYRLNQLEVGVDVDQVTVVPRADLPATLTGALLFYGKPGAYQLSGGLDVTRFRYTTRLDLDTLLKGARSTGSLLVSEAKEPVEWLRYDVDFQTGPDVRIDNNLARAQLSGKVKLAGTNLRPLLVGALEAGEGSQAFFRGNVFSIGRATMQFNGVVPTFDLTTQAQVREYLVNVKAFGRLDDPRVSFSSQPPLSEADILSLLTLGVTSKEEVSSGAAGSLAAEALLSASGLDEQVQRFLSKNSVLKDAQMHLSTTFNPASGKAEPSVSWESKVLSDQLKVGVTQPVTGKGTKAQAEYRFNDRVSGRLQWDDQTDVSSIGNPGLDFRVRFEWE